MTDLAITSLLSGLAEAGYPVATVDDLRHLGRKYPSVVPLLLRALETVVDVRGKHSVVRALSAPWARPEALKPMLLEFAALPKSGARGVESLRWAMGNAIEVLWNDEYFDDLTLLALDPRFGIARQMIVLGFRHSSDPRVFDILVSLLDDEDVNGHAVKVLSKLRDPRASPYLEKMLGDSRSWVRGAAKKGLATLERPGPELS